MKRIVILYSTVDGQTLKIAKRMQRRLEATDNHVVLASLDEPMKAELEDFDAIVLGASIRYGKFRPNVMAFVNQYQGLLARKHSGFFCVNLVARKPEKNTPQTNAYMQKFLKESPWQPKYLGVFAGSLNYSQLRFFDKHIIRFIMWMTKGPTDFSTNQEFTDWGKVEAFADNISSQ